MNTYSNYSGYQQVRPIAVYPYPVTEVLLFRNPGRCPCLPPEHSTVNS